MSRSSQRLKAITRGCQRVGKKFLSAINRQIVWLLRTIFRTHRRRDTASAGFVLPTVVMVSIVVILLTTAILFRSFQRAQYASNVRVNEVVLRAAAPALDRARAKLDKLFQDPRLPRSTPSDFSLTQVLEENINDFTLGDETQLKLVKDVVEPSGTQTQSLLSAWKYPVDTDNNGKFDAYTLYGIYFRTPTSNRPRSTLEARAQPMDEGATSGRCQSNVATSADLVGSQGWYKVGGKLKRSLFVYTTTIPITTLATTPALDSAKYEPFSGNRGFSSLEYQQDRERIPLTNNAVIYENDLEIAPGAGIRINGRVFTNGNLLTRNNVTFYLVSSPYSCYYTEENSKIVIAGNVINTRVNESSDANSGAVIAHLYRDTKPYDNPNSGNLNQANKTVPETVYGNTAAFNDAAYEQRINRLVEEANGTTLANLPKEVQDGVASTREVDSTITEADAKLAQLRLYFKKRTRRVPYAEVPVGENAIKRTTAPVYDYTSTSPLQGSGESLRPVDVWVFPFNPTDGKSEGDYGKVGIREVTGGNKIQLSATDPTVQRQSNPREESRLGDRVLVGNNLPQLWYDGTKFVRSDTGQTIVGKEWDGSTVTRKRFSQANQIDDFGSTGRDGFWEKAAAQRPTGPLDVVGGLRVVTGAGIYLPNNRTPASTATQLNADLLVTDKVWSDRMSMGVTTTAQGLPKAETPYLKMRASVVYHYKDSSYDPNTPATYQTPIACISSYYDPTNSTTAKNKDGLPDFAYFPANGRALTISTNIAVGSGGNSNNGVVYSASSLTGYTDVLNYQASLKYPNGRWVNQPLKKALAKIAASGNLTLSEQSAIDSAICALKILDGTIGSPSDTAVPHGAILETTLLDARQVKATDKQSTYLSNPAPQPLPYDLDVELRQPLEIRTTVINLDLLRRKSKTGGEFLFPNSGIIYATRDDALPDASYVSDPNSATLNDLELSSKDFRLDPTRRPNAIMLINGSDLSRNSTYKAEEKGLILASDLPVYVRAPFNIHGDRQEFLEDLNETIDTTTNPPRTVWDNFYTRGKTPASDLDPNFACRSGQFTTCGTGETWRPATVLADAITILSSNFQLGYRNDGDYDLNDNYGNYPVGYDLNGNGTIDTATLTLNEGALKFDLNLDGDTADSLTTLDETKIGADLNSDGDRIDTSVNISESNLTATVVDRLNGFWDNDFVTSRNFTDSQYSTSRTGASSSYFNNFVTPIQRRETFAEYVMEICPKRTVIACKADDWVVGYDLDGDGDFSDSVTINSNTYTENRIKANQLLKALADAKVADPAFTFNKQKLWAGTTAITAPTDSSDTANKLYPRRVAFLRYGNGLTVTRQDGTALTNTPSNPVDNKLVLDDDKTPVPLALVGGAVKYLPFTNTLTINTVDYPKFDSNSNKPDTASNTLWFRTNKAGANNYAANYPLLIFNQSNLTADVAQPLLVPVLQIQYPQASPNDNNNLSDNGDNTKNNSGWLQIPTASEANLVIAQGDTPGRPPTTGNTGETNGGLENFVRFLENWGGVNLKISGSFIQFKRSSYATAPWQVFIITHVDDNSVGYAPSGTTTLLGYPQGYRITVTQASGASMGRTPFYNPPNRLWGYDVALLTQLPDLFSQRFTSPSVNAPNEFFREVGRDDPWVKTLLCAAQSSGGYEAANAKFGTGYKYAISQDQRPATCP
jgi:type II secretory pathway pseudopilin PulG